MPQNPISGSIGIAWFSADTYVQTRASMADADVLHKTFAEWNAAASRGFDDLTAQGYIVYKAPIEARAFATWCGIRGLTPDAKARQQYAAEYAAAEHTKRGQ